MDKSLLKWLVFFLPVLILLILDLGVFNRKNKEIGFKESLWTSGFYVLIAFVFGFWIYYRFGFQSFVEYLTGFLVEKSLALDNIFVISLVFSSLSIPLKYQHRILFFGIIGVIFMRAIMIGLGARLISEFDWVLYLFSLLMVITGIKMFFTAEKKINIADNPLLLWMRKYLRITENVNCKSFFKLQTDPISKKSYIFATPLFVALVLIEFMDLIFAFDSVPAIFTITKDPYIVYTSNIFAILGLRSLYFSLASIIRRFYYLKFALALVLVFIGSKIFIADLAGIEKFPPVLSLTIVFALLASGCIYSIYKRKAD